LKPNGVSAEHGFNRLVVTQDSVNDLGGIFPARPLRTLHGPFLVFPKLLGQRSLSVPNSTHFDLSRPLDEAEQFQLLVPY
jgi:hypothetical protein